MKKFTFLLVFFVVAVATNAQNSKNLQEFMQQDHQKYLKFNEVVKNVEMQSSQRALQLKSTDATLKLDSVVSWDLDLENETWHYGNKDEYYYNQGLKNTSWINKEWNNNSKSLVLEGKTELEFNKDLITSMTFYSKDEDSGELALSGKYMFYYNQSGMLDSSRMYNADEINGQLVLNMKQYRFYNSAKQIEKTDIWIPDEDDGIFVLSLSVVNTYNESGKIKSTTTNMMLGELAMPLSKTEYNYDGSGNLTSKVNSTMNILTGSGLVNEDRYTYQYNGAGKVKVETHSKWNAGTWMDDEKTEYEFNSAGDVSVEIYSEHDGTKWNVVDKYEYEYGTVNFSQVVYPTFFTSFDLIILEDMEEADILNFSKQVTGMKYYEMNNGALKYTGKTTLYYSSATSTNIAETENATFAVYPNPASESVTFSWKGNFDELTLKVYQITGAQVIEQNTSSGRAVSISKLVNGVYFFKLLDKGQTVRSGKLVKN
jgi:hypothetical protein